LEWSLILKVLYPPADRGQPSDWDYWRREADAYQSGLLDDLPGGLAAPRCFGVVEHPDDTCWIWMEDVADNIRSADDIAGKDAGAEWPLEHYGVVARHLGQFNGAYLTGKPLPSYPWLSYQWLRSNLAESAPAIAQLHDALRNPLVRRAYPPDSVDRILRHWTERERFLDALDRLPQTLCHFDAFRRSLFARRTPDGLDQTVAVDWAFVGIGAVGQDICPLVASTLNWREVDAAEARELDHIAFEGYLDGLRDAGWRGDPREVRFAQTVRSAAGTYALATALPILLDKSRHAWFEDTIGQSITEWADRWAEKPRHSPLGYWEQEAHELLDEMR